MLSIHRLKGPARNASRFLRRFSLSQTAAVDSSTPSSLEERGNSVFVSEIFTSIQGEGPHAGRPSVFLRLGLCNLSCSWCDTPYTWLFDEDRLSKVRAQTPPSLHGTLPPKPFDKASELQRHSVEEVLRLVRDAAGPAVRAVVVTGGEPLLHAKPLQKIVPQLVDDGFKIEFETNGTLTPSGVHRDVHFNVSPKLSNSHQSILLRMNYRILEEYLARNSSVFKFVVSDPEDLDEVQHIVRSVGIDASRVFLMPEGTEPETIKARGRWLAEVCVNHGYNYSHRLHVELWGAKRGV